MGTPIHAQSRLAVGYLQPPVKYRPNSQTNWKKLTESTQTLPPKADILVGDGGALQLKDRSKATIQLNEQSGLTTNIREDTPSKIRLNHGSMRMNVDEENPESNYRIESRSAVIGIRGTEFGVSHERQKTLNVFVDTGIIRVASGRNSDSLASGQAANLNKQPSNDSDFKFAVSDTIPDQLQLTWQHWSLEYQKKYLQQKLAEINRHINRLEQSPNKHQPRLKQLKNVRDFVSSTLSRVKDRYQSVHNDYQSYRKHLRKQREDFIESRVEAFNQYRRRRIKAMKKMQQQRNRGMKKMRRKREKAIESMRKE